VGWNGSGGGWSTKTLSFNTLPSWQHGNGVPTTVNHRLVPDVALGASGSNGAYYFVYNGSLSGGSVGTSFASPVFAGSLAAAEQQIIAQGGLPPNAAGKRRFGRIQNLFYTQNGRNDVWFDVTSGGNGTLPSGGTSTASAGWDYVTGWGAINFNAFVTAVVATAGCPNITTQPTGGTYCEASSISLVAGASGSPAPTFQWQLNNTDIPGATSPTYSVNSAAPTDAGTYTCIATNSCGSATTNQAVVVIAPLPSITQQPQPATQTVPPGSPASFTVVATDASGYQWYRGNHLILGANAATYSIASVAATNAGTYTCEITNDCGVADSDGATLIVGTPPPSCYANCDQSTTLPFLNVGDFTCFLQRYAAGDPYANCDQSTTPPVLNVGDFTCFLQAYAAGCSAP
jgi:hypothetical protein